MSAFHIAASYAKIGIKYLPKSMWTEHSPLALELHTLGAELEVTLGNVDIAEAYISEVLAQKHLEKREQLPILISKSYKLSNIESKHKEALEFLCQTMKSFGYWVPLGVLQPIHALRVLFRTVKAAKKRPISSYETPKFMTKNEDQAAMAFLSRMTLASYFTGNKFMLVFSACQMVQMTLDHGVSTLSGVGYSTFAMIANAVLGDFKTSAFFAETAMVIQKSVPSKFMESHTYVIAKW